MKRLGIIVLCFIVVLVIGSALTKSETKAHITQQDFGKTWPFTVTQGELRCDRDAVTFKAHGTTYAVNGTAGSRGFPRIDPIWRPNPNLPGTRINIGPIIEAGLALCR